MSRGMFGWDLPPGCSMRDIDRLSESGPCDICGNDVDAGACICPDCPVCFTAGNPACLLKHGLTMTAAQVDASFAALVRDIEWVRGQAEDADV